MVNINKVGSYDKANKHIWIPSEEAKNANLKTDEKEVSLPKFFSLFLTNYSPSHQHAPLSPILSSLSLYL